MVVASGKFGITIAGMLFTSTRYMHRWSCLLLAAVVGFSLFFSTGCSEDTEKKVQTVAPVPVKPQGKIVQSVFRSVTAVEAQAMLRGEKGLLLLDVRTPEEIRQMRIAGALAIPVGDVIRGRFVPPGDVPILLVCAIGGRSYIAGKALASRGYREIYNLDGGIEAWRRAGLPLETEWK